MSEDKPTAKFCGVCFLPLVRSRSSYDGREVHNSCFAKKGGYHRETSTKALTRRLKRAFATEYSRRGIELSAPSMRAFAKSIGGDGEAWLQRKRAA